MFGESKAGNAGKQGLILDPRTKLLIVMTISFFMMGGKISGNAIYPRMVLAAVPFVLLLSVAKIKAALLYVLFLAGGTCCEAFLVYRTSGFLSIFITMISGVITRFIPGVVTGYYLVSTTSVSQFVAAMERMRAPRAIVIPLSVMFRFFPTVAEESRSINNAMRMRGIGSGLFGTDPFTLLEYRFVPLISSIVKIGEDLTVAALTRGLGGPGKRTNICEIGFTYRDALFVLPVLTAALFYIVL